MRQRLIPKNALLLLLAAAVMLLVALAVVMGLGRLLAAMGDEPGSRVLDYLALACGALFVFDLVLLVLGLAIGALADENGGTENDQNP